MQIKFLIFLILLIQISNAQTSSNSKQSGKEDINNSRTINSKSELQINKYKIREYFSLIQPQYATIENQRFGKTPSVKIDRESKKVQIRMLMMPDQLKINDPAMLIFTADAQIHMHYEIIKDLPLGNLPKSAVEGFILASSIDTTKKFIFLSLSNTASNICNEVAIAHLIPGRSEYIYFEMGQMIYRDDGEEEEDTANEGIFYNHHRVCNFYIDLPESYKLMTLEEPNLSFCNYIVQEDGLEIMQINSYPTGRFSCDKCDIDEFYQAGLETYRSSDISYKLKKDNWFVISGIKTNGNIFYWKRIKGKTHITDLFIEYPKYYASKIEQHLETITRSFNAK